MNTAASGPRLALVVLAAGASERLGQPKALAPLRDGPGGTALEILLAAAASLQDPCPLVVTGRDHALLAALVAERALGVELCPNSAWSAGRSGSVVCAVARRVGLDLCLAPVDVPTVPARVFGELGAEWRRRGSPARGWLGPFVVAAGRRRFGHPVVVGRELAGSLQDFPPDRPLSALRGRAAPLLALGVDRAEILDDLDTPADLARLRARHA